MANYHSIIHNYGKPQSTFNTELAVKGLEYKQQKYDANAAKIDELLSSYGDLELSRPEAKEYLYEKLNGLVNNINGLEGADLGSRNVTSGILGHISQALDETVINEYQATQNEKDYYAQVQQAKKDKTYNDANFYQGYKQIAEWKESELGTSLGKISYTPYKDVKAEKMEQMEKTFKLKGIERVWSEEANGLEYKMKGKVIEPAEIRAMYNALLTTEDLNQLRIESEYATSRYTDEQKEAKVQEYKENSDTLINEVKNKRDILKAKAKMKSGPEAEALEQEALSLDRDIKNLTETKEMGFDAIAFQMFNENIKAGFVDLYKVNTVTDFEANMDMLDFQYKILRNQKLTSEINELGAEAEFTQVATAGPQGDAATSYVATTMDELDKATTNLVSAVERDVQNLDDTTFEDTYAISKKTYNNKTAEEKKVFLGSKVDSFLKDGIDITAPGTSQEFITAANEYRSANQAFNVVYDEVAKGSEEVAKELFEGMVQGVKQGSFKVDNYNNPVIRETIKNNLNTPYEKLSEETRKIFTIAGIDETLSNDYVGDEATQKVLVKRREKLLSEIKPESKGQFVSVKTLSSNIASNTISGIWKLLTTPMNFLDPIRPNSSNPERTREALEELGQAERRVGMLHKTDQNLSALGSSGFITAPDFYRRKTDGTFEPANAGLHVKGKYENIVRNVTEKAMATAPNLPSTRTTVFNPDIKSEKDDANTLKSILASYNGENLEDLAKEIVEVTYDKSNDSYTISSNIQRKYVGKNVDGRLKSTKISAVVSSQNFPLKHLDKRTKKDVDSWALNAANPQASNLKFSSGGYSSPKQRVDFATTLLNQGRISQEDYLGIMQNPKVIGLTTEEKKTALNVERIEEGSKISLPQEYPNAFANLTNPATKINREVVNRKGMYVTQYTIKTPQGEVSLPMVNTEARQLNYDDQYLKSFTELNEVYNYILQGYAQNNEETKNLLKELNK